MSHEQSETIQGPDGKWINVYGRATPKAGKQLPGTPSYGSVDEAVAAAKARSEGFGFQSNRGGAAVGMQKALARALRR